VALALVTVDSSTFLEVGDGCGLHLLLYIEVHVYKLVMDVDWWSENYYQLIIVDSDTCLEVF